MPIYLRGFVIGILKSASNKLWQIKISFELTGL